MALTSPPPIPQRGDPATFSDRVDAFLTWEGNTLVPELNALEANLSSIAAGGAYSLPFIFDSSTAVGDPGLGKLRLGSATQSSATTMILDNLMSNGVGVPAMQGSTNPVWGTFKLQKLSDPSKYLYFNWTALAAQSGYYNLSVTNVGYSEASPFANGDALILQFTRAGDKGDTNLVQSALIRQQVASGSSSQSLSVGWNTRVLNTLNINEFGVTLSANQFTLPAGGYVLDASAQAGAAANLLHQLRLFNVTSGSVNDLGGSDATTFSNTTAWGRAHLKTMFTLAAAATFRLDHYVNTASAGGSPVSATGGAGEVYTEVRILKVK